MYRSHYQLKKKPFEPAPDPEFIWLSDKHIEIIAQLKEAIQMDDGILAMTGDVGMGKTTFINYFKIALGDDIVSVIISYPDLDEPSFFEFIYDELPLDGNYTSKGAFLFHLDLFLRELSAREKSALIIVDDAQNLSSQMIQAVLFMASIKIEQKKMIKILLMGQHQNKDAFVEKLEKDLSQKINFSHQLDALTRSETHQYISHRLKRAGAADLIFEPEAIDTVYSLSAGCPRLINAICDNALLSGYSSGEDKIRKNLIEDVF
jgi:general secretion pathway protein A